MLASSGARAASGSGFTILVASADGEDLVEQFFPASADWVFGDRAGYRCAYFYLSQDGQAVAKVTIERAGAYEAHINDVHGVEQHPQTDCGTPETPLAFGGTPAPFTIDGATLSLGGLLSDAAWATGGCSNGSPYDYLIYEGAPIVKATVESLGAAVGPCSLTAISSFSPTSGRFGTAVAISGSNLIGATGVDFNGVAAQQFTVDSSTRITATVPAGATTGRISITTADGTVNGAGLFTVTHQTTITLRLRHPQGDAVASGSVAIPDGTVACQDGRRVIIEDKVNGGWHGRGTAVTHGDGSFRHKVKPLRGPVRGRVPKKALANGDVCETVIARV